MTMLTHFYSRINFARNRLGNAADQKRSVARVVIVGRYCIGYIGLRVSASGDWADNHTA